MIIIRWKKNDKDKNMLKSTFNTILEEKEINLKKVANFDINKSKIETDYQKKDLVIKNSGKEIISCKYYDVGIYNKESKIWYWAWNTPFVDRSITIKDGVKGLKSYIADNYSHFTPQEADEYYFYTSNDNFILEQKHVQHLLGIAVSVTNCEGYVVIEKDKIIEYKLIKHLTKVK